MIGVQHSNQPSGDFVDAQQLPSVTLTWFRFDFRGIIFGQLADYDTLHIAGITLFLVTHRKPQFYERNYNGFYD